MTKAEIVRYAANFRSSAGVENTIPYDIVQAIGLIMPVDIVCLSNLTLKSINEWFFDRNIDLDYFVNDRDLHGLIVTFKGKGIIFLNGSDSEDERRFTIAHEISHFIIDYMAKRNRAVLKFGQDILPVLDGLRSPTIDESISGVLFSVDIKPHIHFLEKDADGSFESLDIFESENSADIMALELLAPSQEVIKSINSKGKLRYHEFKDICFAKLVSEYRLPQKMADVYAGALAIKVTSGRSLLDKLGF